MNLLRTLATKYWMMSPEFVDAYLPIALRIAKGEPVQFMEEYPDLPRAYDIQSGRSIEMMDDDDYEQGNTPADAQVMMVYPVKGVVTKYDKMCGPSGMETLMARMKRYDAMSEVAGHLLEIDSGGGEATNIESVARCIRALEKPVLAWYNGTCASAAYYLACAADEVYASEETDEVGSIGALVHFADVRPMWEKEGVKFHEIYADQSELKNLDYKQALQGEYGPMKKQFLNPYAQRFIDTVREFRPGLTDEDAYKGKLYMTAEAIKIGMIDGMATFEEAVGRLQYLVTEKQSNMSLTKLFSGAKTPAPVAEKAPEMISTADVEAAMVEMETMLTDVRKQVENLRTEIADVRANIEAHQAELKSVRESRAVLPGAAPAAAAATDDPPLYATGEEDILDKMEKEAAAAAQRGDTMRIS
jgi:ClpP class serine protease